MLCAALLQKKTAMTRIAFQQIKAGIISDISCQVSACTFVLSSFSFVGLPLCVSFIGEKLLPVSACKVFLPVGEVSCTAAVPLCGENVSTTCRQRIINFATKCPVWDADNWCFLSASESRNDTTRNMRLFATEYPQLHFRVAKNGARFVSAILIQVLN